MKVNLSKGDIFWVLSNLLTLRSGDWPDPEWYDLDLTISRVNSFQTRFANPAEVAGEVELRLNYCGIDGFLVKQVYAWGESVDYLSRNLHIGRGEIDRGVMKALDYITGMWPKRGYREYKNKKGKDYYKGGTK